MAGDKTRGELGEIRASLSSLSGPSNSKPDGVKAKKDVFKKEFDRSLPGMPKISK